MQRSLDIPPPRGRDALKVLAAKFGDTATTLDMALSSSSFPDPTAITMADFHTLCVHYDTLKAASKPKPKPVPSEQQQQPQSHRILRDRSLVPPPRRLYGSEFKTGPRLGFLGTQQQQLEGSGSGGHCTVLYNTAISLLGPSSQR